MAESIIKMTHIKLEAEFDSKEAAEADVQFLQGLIEHIVQKYRVFLRTAPQAVCISDFSQNKERYLSLVRFTISRNLPAGIHTTSTEFGTWLTEL